MSLDWPEVEDVKMAESEGFEPSEQFYPLTRLAIVRLQPLGQLSASLGGLLCKAA